MANRERIADALGGVARQALDYWRNHPEIKDHGMRLIGAALEHPAIIEKILPPDRVVRLLDQKLSPNVLSYYDAFNHLGLDKGLPWNPNEREVLSSLVSKELIQGALQLEVVKNIGERVQSGITESRRRVDLPKHNQLSRGDTVNSTPDPSYLDRILSKYDDKILKAKLIINADENEFPILQQAAKLVAGNMLQLLKTLDHGQNIYQSASQEKTNYEPVFRAIVEIYRIVSDHTQQRPELPGLKDLGDQLEEIKIGKYRFPSSESGTAA